MYVHSQGTLFPPTVPRPSCEKVQDSMQKNIEEGLDLEHCLPLLFASFPSMLTSLSGIGSLSLSLPGGRQGQHPSPYPVRSAHPRLLAGPASPWNYFPGGPGCIGSLSLSLLCLGCEARAILQAPCGLHYPVQHYILSLSLSLFFRRA